MTDVHKFNVTGAGAILDGPEHSLYGIIMSADYTDSQGQTISERELQAAAARFLREPTFKINHQGRPLDGIELAESYVAPASFTLPNGARVNKGQWVCKFSITDEDLYKRLLATPPRGFSIGGTAGLDKSGTVERIHGLRVSEISILLGMEPAQRPSRVLQMKSGQTLAQYLESPEGIAQLKEISAEIEKLGEAQRKRQLEDSAQAEVRVRPKRRYRDFDEYDSEVEHRKVERDAKTLYDRCADSARPLVNPATGRPFRRVDAEYGR